MSLRPVIGVILPALFASALHGQATTCAASSLVPSADVTIDLGASVPPASLFSSYPQAWRDTLLARWASKFVAPPGPGTAALTGVATIVEHPWDHVGGAPFAPGGQYRIRLRRNGRVDRIVVEQPSGSPALDSAVIAAIHALDVEGIGELPEAILRSRAEFRFVVGTAHGSGSRVIPLARWTRAMPLADVAPRRTTPPAPRFTAMSASRPESEVVVEFVVKTDGSVDPNGLRVLWASSRDLGKAALKGMRSARFIPGTTAGCPVPVVTRQRFALGGGPAASPVHASTAP